MGAVAAFFRQPSRPYRNFQIVFTLLTLNFVIPAIGYAVAPELVTGQLRRLAVLLGADPLPPAEAATRLWRYLGASNVLTLGLMCALLQLDLRRFYPVLLPLTFMKAYTAALMFAEWAAGSGHPIFLAVTLLDGITAVLFVWFARGARRDLDGRADADLVPRPRWSRA